MRQYIATRLVSTAVVLFGVSIVIFLLVRMLPGDIIDVMYGGEAALTQETRAALRAEYGLDQPLPVQYIAWASRVAHGDLGRSMRTRELVSTELQRRLPLTLELSFLSLVFAVTLAVPLAILSATRQNTKTDLAARLFGLLGLSLPNFWIATLLLLLTSIYLHWAPPVDWVPLFQDPGQNLTQMLLPTISLGMILVAATMRMLRATLVEVLGEPYVVTARAKGLDPGRVLRRHALKNALIPVITIMGVQMGYLLGGVVIIEQIFSLPGLGSLTLFAVGNRDYALLQGTVLLFSLLFTLTNLIVDVLYGYLDPRIHYE
ncbi:MAG TPA: ABC transporter permease [Chloroflexota bacterium]